MLTASRLTVLDILQVIQTLSVILAIAAAYSNIKGRNSDKAGEMTEMKTDVKYIKTQIDEMKDDYKEFADVKAIALSNRARLEDHLRRDHNEAER